jgi:hypothetical protein
MECLDLERLLRQSYKQGRRGHGRACIAGDAFGARARPARGARMEGVRPADACRSSRCVWSGRPGRRSSSGVNIDTGCSVAWNVARRSPSPSPDWKWLITMHPTIGMCLGCTLGEHAGLGDERESCRWRAPSPPRTPCHAMRTAADAVMRMHMTLRCLGVRPSKASSCRAARNEFGSDRLTEFRNGLCRRGDGGDVRHRRYARRAGQLCRPLPRSRKLLRRHPRREGS